MTVNSLINGTIHILLVEDSESDARLVKEFLKEADIDHVLYVVDDGVEALEFMNTHCKAATNYCPDIVMLDLNLPRMGGIEVLKEMKKDDTLKRIPVIVLTTSTSEEDVQECYGNYANCYIVKPSNLADFENIMDTLKEFWFNTTNLPK
ncbi:response regulator [Methanobacterium sp.]|jgi:chemotaxis family two-component system response regulator Rcp1|uniref:response regulator n=1 Tax=Methanobacterium sp. TaxID=2164 RepID=UPI003158FF6C